MKWFKQRKARRMSLTELQREHGELKVEHIKLDMLHKQQVQILTRRLDQLSGTVNNSMNMNKQIISFLGDIETKLEAYKTILIRKDIMTEDDFDTVWDEIKGVRVRADHELIESGDFARIDFEIRAKNGGELLDKEKGFPIRLGSNTLVVEDKIIGTKVKERLRSFEHTYPKDAPSNAGETVLFNVWVHKVKTKIVEAANVGH